MAATGPDLDTWLDGLARDPAVFAHQLDVIDRRLLLVRLAPEQVHEAAFLDQRVLGGNEAGAWVPLERALEAALPPRIPGGLILHCGHTGSTLVARLLGELPGAWVLREPLILQALAAEARLAGSPLVRLRPDEFSAALAFSQAALAKTPAPAQAAIVKHTSLTANLGARLLSGQPAPAVLCLWIPLEDYLATLLREPGLRHGVRVTAGEWIRDLATVAPGHLPALGELEDGELAALNWCAAQLAFAQARETGGNRVMGWCFDDFLAAPETHLERLAAHFGLAAASADIHRALSSQWLRRYAKDPRYPFDAQARAAELAAAKGQFGTQIRRGKSFARRLWPHLPLDGAFARPG